MPTKCVHCGSTLNTYMNENCTQCGGSMKEDKRKLKPRWYQNDAFNNVVKSDNEECVVELLGGLGKSKVISMLVEHYNKKGDKVVVLTNISELISQLESHMEEPPTVIKSGMNRDSDSNVVLAMEQSFHEDKRKDYNHLKGCILIKDEAIGKGQKRYEDIVSFLEPIKTITTSATPYDEKGVTLYPDALIVNPINAYKAIEQGYSCPVKHFVPKWTKQLDFSEVKASGSDYNSEEIDQIMDADWFKKDFKKWVNELDLINRHTILVVSSIDASEKIAELINATQYSEDSLFSDNSNELKLAVVHSKKSSKYNDRAIELFRKGDIHILVSVTKLAIGFDAPIADTLINLRATKVKRLFNQIVFRVNRLFEGKKYAEHYDIGNNLMTHGFPEADYCPPFNKKDAKDQQQKMSIPEVKSMFEDTDSEEITPNILKAYRAKVVDMKKSIATLKVHELIDLYDIERDIFEVIRIGALIYSKLRKEVKLETLHWIIDKVDATYYTVLEKDLYASMLKKRIKNIIKDNKKFASIYYFVGWMLEESYVNFTRIEYSSEKIEEEDLF